MKTDRHKKILEVIDRYEVGTQEELAKILNDEGYNVTQATVSRDIRALNLTKVSVDGVSQKYTTLFSGNPVTNDKYIRVLREGYMSMDMAQNILVIKTVSGMAMAVAAALDAMHMHEIVGCIAGDDTIICIIRDDEEAVKIMKKLRKIVGR